MVKLFVKRSSLAMLAVVAAVLTGGCELFMEALEADLGSVNPNSEEFRPRFVIGIFGIVHYPRASNLEREVDKGDGTTVWVNTNQRFDSKRIRDARVITRPGNPDLCDLQFRLDDMGKTHWHMLVASSKGEPVVMIVDSRYVGMFIPEMPADDDQMRWVTVRVGVDAYTARGIVKYAKRNYTHYNPNASDFFRW